MPPQVTPFTPSLYQPDAYGRYRQYPRVVDAAIPGVGYDVGRLEWAEQELNLDGSSQPQHYGNYRTVPLRGLGLSLSTLSVRSPLMQVNPAIFTVGDQGAPTREEVAAEDQVQEQEASYDAAAEIERAAAAAQAAAQASQQEAPPGFFTQKVGPVPVWALLAGGVAVAGGGAWWFFLREK